MDHASAKPETETDLKLDLFLPFRLSVLSNAISRRIAAIYQSEFDLTIWQWRIIAVLGEQGDLTSTQLAMRTVTDKPTVSRASRQLIARGLVLRRLDHQDRRRAPMCLTEAGFEIYHIVAPRARQIEAEFLKALKPEERHMLHELLTRLAQASQTERPLWQDADGLDQVRHTPGI